MKGRCKGMSLWNNLDNKRIKNSPRICTQTKKFMSQRTSFCICEKASLTIEASVVLPLTIGFLAIILFFFRVIQVQAIIEEALMYAGRVVAVESSEVSSELALLISAEGVLISVLEEQPIVESYIKHGIFGISLLRSDFSGENIVLRADYKMILPVAFFGRESIELSSENCFRKWVGDINGEIQDDWVYITPTGSVYHTNLDCRVLDIKAEATSLTQIAEYRGMDGQKYYPCSRCKTENGSTVYYTGYGRLYHFDARCSSLKRTIQKISRSEIEGRRECAFCLGS